jgi:hypothetical protein
VYGMPFCCAYSPLEKTPHKATNGELTISCRNRHCPKCQAQARERWLAARERELLDTSYFHVVFTVPHELNVLALENPRLFYDLLFAASTQRCWKSHPMRSTSELKSV